MTNEELLRRTDELLREAERRLRGGDDPSSLVPASLKPKPSRNSGAIALPEPDLLDNLEGER